MKKIASTFLLALLFCIPANAQNAARDSLVLLFETEPGTRPSSLFSNGFESGDVSLLDFNGDDKPELILIKADSITGGVVALRVVDITSNTTLWEVRDINMELGLDPLQVWKQLGFADPDADGEPEAIFVSEQDAVLINPGDNSLEWSCGNALIQMGADPNCVLVGVTDMTDDGYPELFLFLPETRQVQVWGKAN